MTGRVRADRCSLGSTSRVIHMVIKCDKIEYIASPVRRAIAGKGGSCWRLPTPKRGAYLGCVPLPARRQNGWSGGPSKLGSDQIRDFELSATSPVGGFEQRRYCQHICKEERTGKAFPEARRARIRGTDCGRTGFARPFRADGEIVL